MANKIRLTLLSFSCCHPKMAVYDKQYVDRIREAMKNTGIEADIELVTVTEAQLSMRYLFMVDIQPLFQKYGSAVAPALFVDEKLALFGGVPTLEKIEEVLKKAATEHAPITIE
jgi:Thioredoxin domain